MRVRVVLAGAAALMAAACGGDAGPVNPTPLAVVSEPAIPEPPKIISNGQLVGASDVAMCGLPEVEATAKLLDMLSGTIFAAGDLAYPAGSAHDFASCYDPTWGRHKSRTRPAPGNHDYETQRGAAYYAYFGDNAGVPGRGYYSYTEGPWLILALNSNIPASTDSAQLSWVRTTLAATRVDCTLAYWHHPLFSSGPNGDHPHLRELWSTLQDGGVDVVIAGHDHLYERFAPQDADGRPDPARGMRQFTVGTGGAHLYAPKTLRANSEVIGSVHGVLKLTLKPDSYEWQFVPIAGKTFTDFGSGRCH
jgi:hypothetical protein